MEAKLLIWVPFEAPGPTALIWLPFEWVPFEGLAPGPGCRLKAWPHCLIPFEGRGQG